uniref:Uncharacterized protein n=1 Tax=Oryza nivara TaxID=4536 RepID=A0A0E0H8K2_ORYNI
MYSKFETNQANITSKGFMETLPWPTTTSESFRWTVSPANREGAVAVAAAAVVAEEALAAAAGAGAVVVAVAVAAEPAGKEGKAGPVGTAAPVAVVVVAAGKAGKAGAAGTVAAAGPVGAEATVAAAGKVGAAGTAAAMMGLDEQPTLLQFSTDQIPKIVKIIQLMQSISLGGSRMAAAANAASRSSCNLGVPLIQVQEWSIYQNVFQVRSNNERNEIEIKFTSDKIEY